MCRSMTDIRSTAAEIRLDEEKKEDRRKEGRKETTGQKYNGPPITQGGHKKLESPEYRVALFV